MVLPESLPLSLSLSGWVVGSDTIQSKDSIRIIYGQSVDEK